jgi:hypothetical protein
MFFRQASCKLYLLDMTTWYINWAYNDVIVATALQFYTVPVLCSVLHVFTQHQYAMNQLYLYHIHFYFFMAIRGSWPTYGLTGEYRPVQAARWHYILQNCRFDKTNCQVSYCFIGINNRLFVAKCYSSLLVSGVQAMNWIHMHLI